MSERPALERIAKPCVPEPKGHPPLLKCGRTGRAEETVPQNLRAMEKLKIAVVSLSGGTVVSRKSVSPMRAESVADARGR